MAESFDGDTVSTCDAPGDVDLPGPRRRPLRRMRSTTRSFTIGEAKGHLTVALTAQGTPAEVMIRMAKQGSTLAGMLDAFSSTLTRGLRQGVPLKVFIGDYVGMRFEPAGLTNDAEIRRASSVMDYAGRRLALDYLPYEERVALNVLNAEERRTKETVDVLGDWVWTDLMGLSMSAAPGVDRRN
ncbi:ribonucleoside-diphosphate reductase [Streptomyces sp. TS71-3]|uniref:TSCPD domain-containing protein n=1 Tax=Streptomyces sp. TS71-3 TaxID=2733862 RepID=UPI001B244BC0|nr:ribonucleoside-diphosphate reductase [Streptomyces sp. TS71-3]GHJ39699.1 hypothetical protein Sm713_53080 [Streptomyces sp. TS71-3]